MRSLITRPRTKMAAILLAGAAIALSPLGGAASSAKPVDKLKSPECLTPAATGGTAAAAKGGPGLDTRGISQAEQQAIDARTASILKSKRAQGVAPGAGKLAAASIPVYVHVMLSSSGAGDVTASQITQQIAVLNKTYGGQESSQAANTGLTFYLAGTNRYYNSTWHTDGQSTTYRSQTRQGGKNALVRPPPTRPGTGWGSTTPSRAAVPPRTTRCPTHRPRAAPAAARPDATPARSPAWTRSTTTWTTRTTPVITSSLQGRAPG
jgi:hypothetical protein